MSDGSTKTYGIAGTDGQAEAARKEAETARDFQIVIHGGWR